MVFSAAVSSLSDVAPGLAMSKITSFGTLNISSCWIRSVANGVLL